MPPRVQYATLKHGSLIETLLSLTNKYLLTFYKVAVPKTWATGYRFFVSETRNCSGECYPPKTLYQLLSGLRHARSSNDQAPNFLDKTNPTFKPFHAVLHNLFKMLRQDDVGNDSKHAELVSKDEERQLWDAGVMGTSDPESLLRAVFLLQRRDGQEHRCLKLSQFCSLTVPCNHYVYTENASRNRPGGLAQLRLENKTVPIYVNLDAGERCHVSLLDKYISKLPAETVKSNFFMPAHLPKYQQIQQNPSMLQFQ